MKSVIYYVPVHTKFLKNWEYYNVDLDMLNDSFDIVIVCNNFLSFLLNIHKVKYVYCWWWHRSFHIILLSRLLNKITFCTGAIHMFDISGAKDFYKKSFIYRLTSKISLNMSNFNFFISKDQQRQITSHLFVNNPFLLMSSLSKNPSESLDHENILKYKVNQFDSNCINILVICWLDLEQFQRKGVIDFLNSIAQLDQILRGRFNIKIAGATGNAIQFLNEFIKSNSLENIVNVFVDVDNEKKILLYKDSDFYFQPSWHEGFGNSVLEAMSYGCPCIVSRYTAQPEVVGKSGFIVNDIDDDSFCVLLKKIVLISRDEYQDLVNSVLEQVSTNFLYKYRLSRFKEFI